MTATSCPECFTILPASGDCMCGWGLPGVAVKDTISAQIAGEQTRLTRLMQSPDNPQVVLPAPVYVDADALSRFDWHTALIPTLLHAMRAGVVPLRAATTDDVKVSRSKGAAPAPLNLNAVDDADELWAKLVIYVTEVAEQLRVDAPLAVGHVWMNNDEPAGLPAGADADDAHALGWRVQRWFDRHSQNIVDLDNVLWEQTEFLFAEIRKGRAKWLTVKDTVMPRKAFCDVCGTNNVTDEYLDVDGVEHRSTACQMCGHQYRLVRVSKEGQTVDVDVNDVPVIVGTMKEKAL